MKINQLLLISIFAIFPVKLFATAQVPDRIIWEGKTYSLLCNPLEPYFQEYPEKRPQGGFSTALWRGYVATFEIINNQLYLIEIITDPFAEYQDDTTILQKNLVEEIFPGQKKVKVDWFTGLLVIPRGRLINYVHMGYSSTYSKYTLIELENGEFNVSRDFRRKQYERFKRRQFLAFKETEEYREIYNELSKDESYSPEFIDSFIEIYVIDYSTKILAE